MSESERFEKFIESMEKLKEFHGMQYDYFKHLTILGGSALLIIIAFLEKVFEKPDCVILAELSILSFAICVMSSVWALPKTGNMILYITGLRLFSINPTEKSKEDVNDLDNKIDRSFKTIKKLFKLTKITLVIGTMIFLIFLFINFHFR